MENVKVYFLDEEVASFNNLEEAINYIKSMLSVDKELHKDQFTIYSRLFF